MTSTLPEGLKGDLVDIKDLNEESDNEMDMGVEEEGVQDAGSRLLENLTKAINLDGDYLNDEEGSNKGNDPSDNEAQQDVDEMNVGHLLSSFFSKSYLPSSISLR
ncbi:hypothetical protein LENED_009476 [Lentinula edodes]|uniref:Uncharacterized protein n=1 Tax=Lentinula edodes TaxID=5353 RepID=A0A1Q3EJU8_LENED|nr:hypothetical protein LENED_009476 [Lentinula edodes]